MSIQLEHEYKFKQEFCIQILKESKYIFERRKKDLLKWLTDFFDYEVIQKRGCPDKIIIHDVYKDYIKIPRKGCDIDGVLLIRKQREKVIQDFLLKEVFIEPEEDIFLFYVDILKKMENKIDKKLFNIQDKTIIYGYMKPVLNRIAENIPPREWRWVGNYAELEPDVLDYWRQMINIIKRQQGLDFFEEAYILRYQGEETPFHDKCFGDALKQMEEKFGNIPVLVKRWRLREEYKNI